MVPSTQNKRLLTHEEFEDALQRAFNSNKDVLEDYYDTKLTWRRWVQMASPDDVAMLLDNESSLHFKYFQFLPPNVNVETLMVMYINGELKNQPKPVKPNFNNIQIEPTPNVVVEVPWQPQELPYYTSRKFKNLYNKAKERVNRNNRQEVYEARKNLLFAFNRNPRLADISGIPQTELNSWIRNNAGLTVQVRDLEKNLNQNIPDEHQWLGFSNSSWINRQNIDPQDIDQFVGSIDITKQGDDTWTGRQGDVLRRCIMNTFLSIDTRISYKDLNFMIGKCTKSNTLGQYFNQGTDIGDVVIKPRTIIISELSQHTVAHEIGHYLDYKWGSEYGPTGDELSSSRYYYTGPQEHKQWAIKYQEFISRIEDKADLHSEYTQRRSEVFARFIDHFQRWTSQSKSSGHYDDKFGDSDCQIFVRLLQEKSYLDARFPIRRDNNVAL